MPPALLGTASEPSAPQPTHWQLLSFNPTSLQHGWAVKPPDEQRGEQGVQEQSAWAGEINGPDCGV